VLLLDDLLSELDMQRRTHLLQAIRQPEQQTILTATDLGAFDASFLESTTCLRVEQGHIYAMH
jgi:DNA replication and repair protein RecF